MLQCLATHCTHIRDKWHFPSCILNKVGSLWKPPCRHLVLSFPLFVNINSQLMQSMKSIEARGIQKGILIGHNDSVKGWRNQRGKPAV